MKRRNNKVEAEPKKSSLKIILPTLLIAGIIICALLYRSDSMEQLSSERDRQLFEPGNEQSYLFASEIDKRYDILEEYAEELAKTDTDSREQAFNEKKAGALKYGFSDLIAVEKDAGLGNIDEAGAAALQGLCKAALSKGNALDEVTFNEKTYFAFAVPFDTSGDNSGALIGCYSGETMKKLLEACDIFGSKGSIIFNSEGSILIGSGKLPQFEAANNVFEALNPSQGESASGGGLSASLREAVSTDGKKAVQSSFEGESYDYAIQPLGINDWYILNSIEVSATNRQNTKSLFLLIALILLALLLLVVFANASNSRRREIREGQVRLDEATYVDPLTGLFNKPGFETQVRKSLAELEEERACAIVSFEVVSFRSYNALYGFEAGDALLRKIADITREINCDVAGRLYADHFVILVNGENEEDIFGVLRRGVASAVSTGLPFFLCGGIYIVDSRDMPVTVMIDKAGIAKDTIKYKFGTGIAIYSDSMLECQLEDAELVGSMMKSLRNGEFIDYYQPKYNLDTETIAGVEALVRWKKPDGEIIMPGRFIELFEKNGFIRRLDFHTFEKACEMLEASIERNEPIIPVSVNFSRVHLYDSHFPQRIYNIAKKHGVDAKYLEIELTESAFLMDGEELSRVVDRLHEFGFTVAIDDFGSGFSSLNMLKDVPVDVLKIDMKFLKGFERGGRVGTVVTSVIRMSKWLGIPVVAEGVETKEQIEFLRTLGCEMVQGFYYSRPVSREDYEKILDSKDAATFRRCDKPPAITQDSINAVMGGDSLVNSLVDGIFGGFGLYELSENRLEALRVNRSYCEILGYPDMSSFSGHSRNILTQVYPSDVAALLDACFKAVGTGKVQKFTIRRYDFYGNLRQFSGLIKHVGGSERRPLVCITFLDATEKIQADREKELNKYGDALTGIFDEIWEFNYTSDTVRLLSSNHVRRHEKVSVLREVERNWLENKVFPEDRGIVESMTVSARADKLVMPSTLEYRVYRNRELRWISSSMVSVAGGSYLLCNLDITDKKQYELLVRKFEDLHRRVELDGGKSQ